MFSFLTPTRIFFATLPISFSALALAIRSDEFKHLSNRIINSKLFGDIMAQFSWPVEFLGLSYENIISIIIYFPALIMALCFASLCTILFAIYERAFLKPGFFSEIKKNVYTFVSDSSSRTDDYMEIRTKCRDQKRAFEPRTKERLILTSSLIRDMHELRSYVCSASDSHKISVSLYLSHVKERSIEFSQEFKIDESGVDNMNFHRKKFNISEGFVGECARTRTVIIRQSRKFFGIIKSKNFKSFGKSDDHFSKSILCIPVRTRSNGITYAVLSIESSERSVIRPHFLNSSESEEVCIKIAEVIGRHLILLESKMIRMSVEIMLNYENAESKRRAFWKFWQKKG